MLLLDIANGTVGLDLQKSNLFVVSVCYGEARGMDTTEDEHRERRERKARSFMLCRGSLASASHFEFTIRISTVKQCF